MDNNIDPNANIDENAPDEDVDTDDINSQSEDTEDGVQDTEVTQNIENSEDDDDVPPSNKKWWEHFAPSSIARNFSDWWSNLSPRGKYVSIGVAVLLIIASIIIAAVINTGKMVVVGHPGNQSEAGEVLNMLRNNKIKYSYDRVLGTISVREQDAANVVMILAQEGYFQEGYFFEPIHSSGMFMTDSDKRREEEENLRRRIETAINTLDGVSFSVVMPVIADNRNNILRSQQQQSSMHIIVHMEQGRTLSEKAIRGIETLATGSLPELPVENVSIQDGRTAEILNGAKEEDSTRNELDMREFLMNLQRQYVLDEEARIYDRVAAQVAPLFEYFTLAVNVEPDFDRWIEEVIIYDGPNVSEETGEMKGMPFAEAWDRAISHSTDSSIIGEAGTPLNIDDPGYYDAVADPEEGLFNDEFHITREYLVNELRKQLERNTPSLKSATLSLAVHTLLPPEDFETEGLIDLMGTASGISIFAMREAASMGEEYDKEFLQNYITVLPIRFNIPGVDEIPEITRLLSFTPFQWAIILAIILAVLILLAMLLVMLLKKKREREEALLFEDAVDMGEYGEAFERRSSGEESAEAAITPESRERMLKNQIKVFIDQNPEVAAQVIKAMLKEEGK